MKGKTYKNIFSGEIVKVKKLEHTSSGTVVIYNRKNPVIVKLSAYYEDERMLTEFAKPLRVFDKQYKAL